MTDSKRIPYIDFLRFIGITLIILAHVNAPDILIQIRCFDVPLMLFVSGLSYANKDVSNMNWTKWMIKRLKRLIIPVWLYLLFFFIVYSLLLHVGIVSFTYSRVEVIGSFSLLTGRSIGFVWIYRVFILIMLVTPLLLRFHQKLSNIGFVVFFVALIIFNEFLIDVALPDIQGYKAIHYVMMQVIPYILGYSVPFLLGVRLYNCTQKETLYYSIFIFVVFVFASISYYFKDGQWCHFHPFYKYPPKFFFIIYGLFVCSFLWLIRNKIKDVSRFGLVGFVGSNTTWIYLFHILFVILARIYINHWMIRFVVVYTLSIFVYAAWYHIIKRIIDKDNNIPLIKYLIG